MTFIHVLIVDELAEFLLGGNPWLCDCNMEWLLSTNHRSTPGTSGTPDTPHPRILDLDHVTCHLNGQANSSQLPVLQVKKNHFTFELFSSMFVRSLIMDYVKNV